MFHKKYKILCSIRLGNFLKTGTILQCNLAKYTILLDCLKPQRKIVKCQNNKAGYIFISLYSSVLTTLTPKQKIQPRAILHHYHFSLWRKQTFATASQYLMKVAGQCNTFIDQLIKRGMSFHKL